SMQYVLEEGSKNDWFADDQILFLAIVAAVSGVAFVWRSLSYFQPIVELRAFKNRNFTIGVIMTFVTGASLFGGTFLMPLFLGRVRGYSASEVGTTMVVSGLTMFLTAPIAGRLARALDPRILMCVGFSMVAWGMWDAHAVTSEWGFWQFAGVQAFRGVGVMVAMIASQNVTMSTLPVHLVPAASGLVNLSRNVGGAMGLALLSTTLTEKTALHMGELSSRITTSNAAAVDMIAGLTARMQELGAADPEGAAAKAFQGMISQQAVTLAFGDGFVLLAAGAAIAAVAALFAAPSKPGAVAVEAH
ncbi:MAG: MFS transporter, partial [Phenylobacterium sp.]|nr:MFS transporter [Phenylobacterium sp.]